MDYKGVVRNLGGAAGRSIGRDPNWLPAPKKETIDEPFFHDFVVGDCALACVKGGGQFVFVSDGKVYKIANQDSPLLMMHAGHANVTLSGDMKGDTITVAKVAMPAKK